MCGEAGLIQPLEITCKYCHQQGTFGYCQCGNFNPVTFLEMVRFWSRTRGAGVGVANVFNAHPDKDNEQLFFGSRADDVCLDLPALQAGSKRLFLLKENRHHLEALEEEIRVERPNILVLLGNTACWAILGQTGITKIRGTVQNTRLNTKALPTFHPAALRDWGLRPTIVADLKKAQSESHYGLITRPKNWLQTYPTLDEIEVWFSAPAARYSCDIESGSALFSKSELNRMRKHTPKSYNTLVQQISMVGFAKSEEQGLVIPFITRNETNGTLENYWPDQWHEVRAWEWVQFGLSSGAELIFQNGMYDINRLLHAGMRPRNMAHDTMLLHHALFPEMPKGLGYLDSIYRNDSPWKTQFQSESLKRDD